MERCVASSTLGPVVRLGTTSACSRINTISIILKDVKDAPTNVIKLHNDVRSNGVLYGDRLLWCKESGLPRKWTRKQGSVFSDFCELT
jgi:hypothetical protein